MIKLSVQEIAIVVAGKLHGTDGSAEVAHVVADSRQVSNAAMYVAIRGERVDGHDYAEAAIAAGAAVVLSERELAVPCIVVDDSVKAIGKLARHIRLQLKDCAVIAITASSGKTSTKDLLASVLDAMGPTVAPEGSFNTEVGVPLTIFRADESTRFLILEMGMRGAGHIALLCRIAQPQIGVLLNVGSAHLGLLGSREEVAKAKGELIASLPADGLAILNGDDSLVRSQASRSPAPVAYFGRSPSADVRASDVQLDRLARASFTLLIAGDGAEVRLQMAGEHFVDNALAVAAVAHELGMSTAQIAQQLSDASISSRWRMEVTVTRDDVMIVNDAYNANPESMAAALRALAAMDTDRRHWAVLGEMLELGDASPAEHAKLGSLAAQGQVSRLLCIGPATRTMLLEAQAQPSWTGRGHWVSDVPAALALLESEVRAGDIVLIKASRGVGLERLATALGEREPQ